MTHTFVIYVTADRDTITQTLFLSFVMFSDGVLVCSAAVVGETSRLPEEQKKGPGEPVKDREGAQTDDGERENIKLLERVNKMKELDEKMLEKRNKKLIDKVRELEELQTKENMEQKGLLIQKLDKTEDMNILRKQNEELMKDGPRV